MASLGRYSKDCTNHTLYPNDVVYVDDQRSEPFWGTVCEPSRSSPFSPDTVHVEPLLPKNTPASAARTGIDPNQIYVMDSVFVQSTIDIYVKVQQVDATRDDSRPTLINFSTTSGKIRALEVQLRVAGLICDGDSFDIRDKNGLALDLYAIKNRDIVLVEIEEEEESDDEDLPMADNVEHVSTSATTSRSSTNDAAAAAATAAAAVAGVWNCTACTMENTRFQHYCSVCQTRKPLHIHGGGKSGSTTSSGRSGGGGGQKTTSKNKILNLNPMQHIQEKYNEYSKGNNENLKKKICELGLIYGK